MDLSGMTSVCEDGAGTLHRVWVCSTDTDALSRSVEFVPSFVLFESA